LLGKDAPGLSATTIARLKEVWTDEHKRWSERDLSAKSYVYVWAELWRKLGDGVRKAA
jgi:putative transposase